MTGSRVVVGNGVYLFPVSKLSHIDESGRARMVDVGDKSHSQRRAVAAGTVQMQASTLKEIMQHQVPKGDVLAVARVAGIQAAKRCSDLIPLCHPLPISKISVGFQALADDCLEIRAECGVTGQTGVEMEALTAVSVAALTVYDMCKAIDKGMIINDVRLLEKAGGKSGQWTREPGDG